MAIATSLSLLVLSSLLWRGCCTAAQYYVERMWLVLVVETAAVIYLVRLYAIKTCQRYPEQVHDSRWVVKVSKIALGLTTMIIVIFVGAVVLDPIAYLISTGPQISQKKSNPFEVLLHATIRFLQLLMGIFISAFAIGGVFMW